MINQVRDTLLTVCKSLNANQVDYMIIGGIAVGIQGFPRYTADIDIWYEPSVSNYYKVLAALQDIGVDISSLKEIVFDPKKTFLRVPDLSCRVEFLPHIPGIDSFRRAKKNAITVDVDDIKVSVLGFDDLIKNKEALKRPIDLRDVEELKKRKR